jgi:GT2 family glycosyltransferase
VSLRATVIVPVHDKMDTMEIALYAVLEQDAPRESFDVVVVDDHCNDACAEALLRFCRSNDLQLIVRREQPPSASRARNAGLAAARGERLLLLDSDVVLPRDALSRLIAAKAEPDVALLVETYGSSVADTIWEFLAPVPDTGRPFDWAALAPLADARVAQEFDHLAAPWMYFWTTAVWIDRARLQRLGGFEPGLSGKGSEDIELGYRLHRDGVRLAMADGLKALHLPHPRDRAKQECLDRIHERQSLATHRDLAVEMLCAFDAGNAAMALNTFSKLNAERLDELPRPTAIANVLRGEGPVYLGPWISPDERKALGVEDRIVQRAPLIGFALPDADEDFATAVLPDLRGLLPEAAICRLIQEAWRVAREVYVLRWSVPPAFVATLHDGIWRHFDRPYWERSQPVSRSYYDWHARCVERIVTSKTGVTLDILHVEPATERERQLFQRVSMP